jgi:hypothetical protein
MTQSFNQDLDIPMYAEDEEALRKIREKRNDHFKRMRNARKYWVNQRQSEIDDNFWLWLRDDYGIVPHRDLAGNITSGVDIVDERLYTLFLLKFS